MNCCSENDENGEKMPLNREKIEKNLKNNVKIRLFSTVGSTNDEAKRSAESDSGVVLYAAESQTAGRGRRGRSFWSPATGLYMTLSLPVGDTADVQRLTCAAAVAVCGAITSLSELQPAVKWVNDIYVDGRKVAGILAELILDKANRPLRVIIGVGVNLTTRDFPAAFAARAGSVGDLDASMLCAAIADNLIDSFGSADDSSIMNAYRRLNFCPGKRITYTDRDGTHTAAAVDIAPDGSLVILENGCRKLLHSGEISITTE